MKHEKPIPMKPGGKAMPPKVNHDRVDSKAQCLSQSHHWRKEKNGLWRDHTNRDGLPHWIRLLLIQVPFQPSPCPWQWHLCIKESNENGRTIWPGQSYQNSTSGNAWLGSTASMTYNSITWHRKVFRVEGLLQAFFPLLKSYLTSSGDCRPST